MIFYRLQSNNYNITPEHISFNCNFETIDEAMESDLLDGRLLSEDVLKKLLNTKKIKDIWNEYKSSNSLYGWVEPGTCCYRKSEDLFKYFEDYFTEINNNEGSYILIFEGEFIAYGSEGEDCVKFIKEIERMSITEFENKIKNNNIVNRSEFIMKNNWMLTITEEKFNYVKNVIIQKEEFKEDYVGKIQINKADIDLVLRDYDKRYCLDFDVYIEGYEGYGEKEDGTPYGYFDGGIIFDANTTPSSFEEFKTLAERIILDFAKGCKELNNEIK